LRNQAPHRHLLVAGAKKTTFAIQADYYPLS
jgi:hypothetical protein